MWDTATCVHLSTFTADASITAFAIPATVKNVSHQHASLRSIRSHVLCWPRFLPSKCISPWPVGHQSSSPFLSWRSSAQRRLVSPSLAPWVRYTCSCLAQSVLIPACLVAGVPDLATLNSAKSKLKTGASIIVKKPEAPKVVRAVRTCR